jgi:hypothetical protein
VSLIVDLNPIGLQASVAQNVGGFATQQANQQAALRQQAADDSSFQVRNNAAIQGQRLSLDQQRIAQAGDLGQQRVDQGYYKIDQNHEDAVQLQTLRDLAKTGQINQQGQIRLAQLEKTQAAIDARQQGQQTFTAGQNQLKFENQANLQDDRQEFDQQKQKQSLEFKSEAQRVRQQSGMIRAAMSSAVNRPQYDAAAKAAADNIGYARNHYGRVASAFQHVQDAINGNQGSLSDMQKDKLFADSQRLQAAMNEALQAYHDAVDAGKAQRQQAIPAQQAPPPAVAPVVPPFGGGQPIGLVPPQYGGVARPADLSGYQGDPNAAGPQPQQPFYPGEGDPGGGTGNPQAVTQLGGGPVPIKSDVDYQLLPSGTQYVAPDGSVRVKR